MINIRKDKNPKEEDDFDYNWDEETIMEEEEQKKPSKASVIEPTLMKCEWD